MKGTGVIDPTVQLLGRGGQQTINVQSDMNKLSQDQQKAVSKNVQKALVEVADAHAPKTDDAHAHTTTTTTAKPATTTTAKAGAAAAGSTTTSAPTTTTTSPASSVPSTQPDKVSVTNVGPTWGSSITDKAIEALIIFFIVVAIYISIRFEPKMALAAFIAMIHDVLVAIGIYSIFNFQVTPDTVVAILTILGYSLYDTVVVFDRVRDNTKGIGSSGRLTYPQLINLSMNQTLARSINTSMVAILPVLAVLLIGAQLLGATTLQSYGLALFVGLLSGAYSSIFIASPVLCMMKEREDRWVQIADRLAKRGESTGVLLGRRRREHEHGDERRRLGPGEPGRGWPGAEGQQQTQRADPAGLGQRFERHRSGGRRRRRRRDCGDGQAARLFGFVGRRPRSPRRARARRAIGLIGTSSATGAASGAPAAQAQGQAARTVPAQGPRPRKGKRKRKR